MEIKMQITDITHDDLVNLFSTALYGSSWMGCAYDRQAYISSDLYDQNDCLEDRLAKIMLNGGRIEIIDHYAEDEDDIQGHVLKEIHWDDENECMRYIISLDDIKKGLQRACKHDYAKTYVMNLCDQDGSFDQAEAEALMQFIIFGEEVYG